MRIINLEDFKKLPIGTLYREVMDSDLGPLYMKGNSMDNDYSESELFMHFKKSTENEDRISILNKMKEDSSLSFETETDCFRRNGLYQKDLKYAIVEKKDFEDFLDCIESTDAY